MTEDGGSHWGLLAFAGGLSLCCVGTSAIAGGAAVAGGTTAGATAASGGSLGSAFAVGLATVVPLLVAGLLLRRRAG